ncbi:hypothetical protein FRC08_010966 [Ceratobasidium sp. 394]|nr:hypothetical protein FRC08_010966 [Ceratobasidium sp. 394]
MAEDCYSVQAQTITPVSASPAPPSPTAVVPSATGTSRSNSAGKPGVSYSLYLLGVVSAFLVLWIA